MGCGCEWMDGKKGMTIRSIIRTYVRRTPVDSVDGRRALYSWPACDHQALTTHNPTQSYYLFIGAEGKAAQADDDDVDLFGDDDVSLLVGGS